MSDSKSGSKDNLNESNVPLLSEDGTEKTGETPEKEVVDMELEEKKDETTEKETVEKKKKKVKVPKEKGPSCIDINSSGLDMITRDKRGINMEIDLDFDDVLAEPSTAHGFDPVWRLSFVLFSQTKLWVYRIISAVIAIPLSLLWAVIFSLLSVSYVWVVRPILRIVEMFLAILRRFWISLLQATLEPLCDAIGAVFGSLKLTTNTIVQSV